MKSVSKVGLLALACAGTADAVSQYILGAEDTYQGMSFFDKFDFFSAGDPNVGFVIYQDQQTAASSRFGGPLINSTSSQAYLGVDYWNKYGAQTQGRPAIRVESKKTYNYGLFIFDIAHMPSNTCGTWPAIWTTNTLEWPRRGEIDILENIHEETNTLETLHTAPGCTVSGNKKVDQMTGTENTYNCDDKAVSSPFGSQYTGQGCSSVNNNANNYGSGFNAVGGGVYAMEWTNASISIWHFTRGGIPADITLGSPSPSTWGKPVFTTSNGDCNMDTHFKDHKVIIDTTFCGNWAGQDQFWQKTSCYKANPTLYPDCKSYVAANPSVYKDAYWLVNSLKVYQMGFKDVLSTSKASTKAPATSTTVAIIGTPTVLSVIKQTTLTPTPSSASSVSSPTGSKPSSSTSLPVVIGTPTASLPTSIPTSASLSIGVPTSPTKTETSTGLSISIGSSSISAVGSPTPSSTKVATLSVATSVLSISVGPSSSVATAPPAPSAYTVTVSLPSAGSTIKTTLSIPGSTVLTIVVPTATTKSSRPGSTIIVITVPTSPSVSSATSKPSTPGSSTLISTTKPHGNWSSTTKSHSQTSETVFTTSTVWTTSISTITKCPPSVTSCPIGSTTHVTVPVSTTICPVTSKTKDHTKTTTLLTTSKTKSRTEWTTSTVCTTSVSTVTSCHPHATGCSVGHTTTVTIPLYTTVCPVTSTTSPASIPPTKPLSTPLSTTSTVYTTIVSTITSCPPSVTSCPIGSLTTKTSSLYTTVCEVSSTPSVPTYSPSSYTTTTKSTTTLTRTSTIHTSTSTISKSLSVSIPDFTPIPTQSLSTDTYVQTISPLPASLATSVPVPPPSSKPSPSFLISNASGTSTGAPKPTTTFKAAAERGAPLGTLGSFGALVVALAMGIWM